MKHCRWSTGVYIKAQDPSVKALPLLATEEIMNQHIERSSAVALKSLFQIRSAPEKLQTLCRVEQACDIAKAPWQQKACSETAIFEGYTPGCCLWQVVFDAAVVCLGLAGHEPQEPWHPSECTPVRKLESPYSRGIGVTISARNIQAEAVLACSSAAGPGLRQQNRKAFLLSHRINSCNHCTKGIISSKP